MRPLDARLSAAEIEQLAALLANRTPGQDFLRLDQVQGLCAALAMGPDAEASDGWLGIVLGTDQAREPACAELVLLLERFRVSITQSLDAKALVINAHETRTGRLDYRGWCAGFLEGVAFSDTSWFEAADPEEIDELLFPIEVLADTLPVDERASYSPAEWRRLQRDCEAALARTVSHLADYWSIVRTPPVTFRREQKVGRNDPCPCGSGAKFKQCHGKS